MMSQQSLFQLFILLGCQLFLLSCLTLQSLMIFLAVARNLNSRSCLDVSIGNFSPLSIAQLLQSFKEGQMLPFRPRTLIRTLFLNVTIDKFHLFGGRFHNEVSETELFGLVQVRVVRVHGVAAFIQIHVVNSGWWRKMGFFIVV